MTKHQHHPSIPIPVPQNARADQDQNKTVLAAGFREHRQATEPEEEVEQHDERGRERSRLGDETEVGQSPPPLSPSRPLPRVALLGRMPLHRRRVGQDSQGERAKKRAKWPHHIHNQTNSRSAQWNISAALAALTAQGLGEKVEQTPASERHEKYGSRRANQRSSFSRKSFSSADMMQYLPPPSLDPGLVHFVWGIEAHEDSVQMNLVDEPHGVQGILSFSR